MSFDDFISIPEVRDNPHNASIISYLAAHRPSAHSDLVFELERALRPSGEGGSPQLFCSTPQSFGYVVAFDAEGTLFALAEGMQALKFRVAASRVDEALADGGKPVPALGAHWVAFSVFAGDLEASRARLARWAEIAASKPAQGAPHPR